MKYIFVEYPKCSTCKDAKKWLEGNKVEFKDRNIVTETPSFEELKEWIKRSGYPIKKFFNTSGILYREMRIKEQISTLNEEEQIKLLISNGMLIKRPILVGDSKVLVGFKKDEWETIV